MLKDRRNAAAVVAADFLVAESAADAAALLAANCVATMLKARSDARLPIGTGARALRCVSDAASELLKARQHLIEAHSALVETRDAIGLRATMFGDEGDCDKYMFMADASGTRGGPALSIVA